MRPRPPLRPRLAALALLATAAAHAQPAAPASAIRVRGQVLVRGTRTPAAGAQLTAVPRAGPSDPPAATFEAEADAEGRFTLAGLPPGEYTVVVTGSGLVRASFEENLAPGTRLDVRYFVDRTWASRYESVVRASAGERQELARLTLTTEELLKIPGTKGDALRALENLPGAGRAPFGIGLFIIRGGKPTDSRAFVAASEVPQLYHFGGLSSIFPSLLVERIDYLPGNFGVRYGRAIAGVVDLDLRAGRRDRLHGYVDINVFDAGAAVEGPVGKGSFVLGVRRSYIDAVLAAVAASGVLGRAPLSFTTAPVYYDYQAQLDYPLLGGRFRALVHGSDDQLRLLLKEPQGDASVRGDLSTHITFHRLQLSFTRQRGPLSIAAILSTGYSGTSGALGTALDFDLGAVSTQARLEATWRYSKTLRLTGGLDAQVTWNRITANLPPPPREGEPMLPLGATRKLERSGSFTSANIALYAEAHWQATGRLSFTPGLRLDYFGAVRSLALDPRLVARYQLRPTTALKGGLGHYSQDPQPQDYDPVFGNPRLRPEHAVHLGLGLEQRLPYGLSLEVSAFYKHLYDLAVPSANLTTRDGRAAPERVSNDGIGRVYGGELLLRHALSRWLFGWISYTLMRSERRDAPGLPWRVFDFDQTHVLIVAFHANLPRGFEVGLRFRYLTGYPYTAVRSGVYNADADVYLPGRSPTGINTERLDGFHQLDLRVDKTFVFKYWMLRLYLDVANVYNHQNEERVQFSYDYARSRPFTGLPIIPSLGIRGEF